MKDRREILEEKVKRGVEEKENKIPIKSENKRKKKIKIIHVQSVP